MCWAWSVGRSCGGFCAWGGGQGAGGVKAGRAGNDVGFTELWAIGTEVHAQPGAYMLIKWRIVPEFTDMHIGEWRERVPPYTIAARPV
jgi:hypothetical protein